MPWHLVATPAAVDVNEAYLAAAILDNVDGLGAIVDQVSAGTTPQPEQFERARARLTVTMCAVSAVIDTLSGPDEPLVDAGRQVTAFLDGLGPVIEALSRGDLAESLAYYADALSQLPNERHSADDLMITRTNSKKPGP